MEAERHTFTLNGYELTVVVSEDGRHHFKDMQPNDPNSPVSIHNRSLLRELGGPPDILDVYVCDAEQAALWRKGKANGN